MLPLRLRYKFRGLGQPTTDALMPHVIGGQTFINNALRYIIIMLCSVLCDLGRQTLITDKCNH